MTLSNLIDQAAISSKSKDLENLDSFLNLQYGDSVQDYLSDVLLQPVNDLTKRPGKKIRGRLVEIGYELALALNPDKKTNQRLPAKVSLAIEYLHAGSLAVDDLQDGSKMRRGEPTLHLKYGLPLALNTGNWLYFWPLEVIRQCQLPPKQELDLYHLYHETLLHAHVGQALDVGVSIVRVPQKKVSGLCLSTIELKSGALFSLAMVSGAILAGADKKTQAHLNEFGRGFGMALQMFDDLGNMKGKAEPTKKWEDLMLRRPTWIWHLIASRCSSLAYNQFLNAVYQLPQDRCLQRWLEHQNFFQEAVTEAKRHLSQCFSNLQTYFEGNLQARDPLKKLKKLADEVSTAYE